MGDRLRAGIPSRYVTSQLALKLRHCQSTYAPLTVESTVLESNATDAAAANVAGVVFFLLHDVTYSARVTTT